MEECLFCKIINNEVPSHKVYEDDSVLAFLDIHPMSKGHTLIVPKKHSADIMYTEEEVLQKIIVVAKKISKKMKDSLGVDGVNLYHASGAHAEQTVFHFHLHVIPRRKDDDICFNCAVIGKDSVTPEELAETANKLKIEG